MNLTSEQQQAADWIANNSGLLIATPGTGKTRTTLAMLAQTGKRALIIAPASVARRTWQDEQRKVGGRPIYQWRDKTANTEAFAQPPHVIVSYELAPKYLREFGAATCGVVIFDEITRLRNPTGKRFHAIRRRLDELQQRHRIGLTGTPAANHYHQLYGQLQITAGLPMIYEQWLKRFFVPQLRGGRCRGYTVWLDGPNTGAMVAAELAPRSWIMPPAREQKRRVIDHWVKANVHMNDQGGIVEQQQYAQGRIYVDQKETRSTELHTAKRDRLVELLQDLQGEPVLIFNQFRHDLIAIEHALQKANVPEARVSIAERITGDTLDAWNSRKLNALVVHPGSAGHGLNLQQGGHQIIWYGLPWDAELYEQGIGRLDRQGQTETVMVHRILTEDSVDGQIVRTLDVKRKKGEKLTGEHNV